MTTDSKASDVEAREREAFEAAMRAAGFDSDHYYKSPVSAIFGDYENDDVQHRWEGWQLARASQQPSAQWIAVSERLPHESARVLVVCDDEPEPLGARYLGSSHGWIPSPGNYELEGVTHWQPLPAAPDTARTE